MNPANRSNKIVQSHLDKSQSPNIKNNKIATQVKKGISFLIVESGIATG
jgi:hypothetical protein